jgi:oxygen-independent coproporphyrinogen III oxidase
MVSHFVSNFGLYIHIPFCLQRCYYCDFATYTQEEACFSIEKYVEILCLEIKKIGPFVRGSTLKTLYFGGGTPSLLSPMQLEKIQGQLREVGLSWGSSTEVTIEINPATLDSHKLKAFLQQGVNRFSVGAQTFDDITLKKLNRKHTAQETRETLKLLKEEGCHYSFDLLFGLPHQTLKSLTLDLEEIAHYLPHHISPYYLTLKDSHFLNRHRPPEETEIRMFQEIRSFLMILGYEQYEISNFARKKEYRSQHNSLYWDDQSYLGLGLGSHSYWKEQGFFGARFSNPTGLSEYAQWVTSWNPQLSLLDERNPLLVEILEKFQALTEYCYISLRRHRGLSLEGLQCKFGSHCLALVQKNLDPWIEKKKVLFSEGHWSLTDSGKDLSNQIFLDLTFSKIELTK